MLCHHITWCPFIFTLYWEVRFEQLFYPQRTHCWGMSPPRWLVFSASGTIGWQPPLRKHPIMWLRRAMFADCPLMPSACEAAETPGNCCFSRCQGCCGGSLCTYPCMHAALCSVGLGCQLKLSTQQSASHSCWFPVGPW